MGLRDAVSIEKEYDNIPDQLKFDLINKRLSTRFNDLKELISEISILDKLKKELIV